MRTTHAAQLPAHPAKPPNRPANLRTTSPTNQPARHKTNQPNSKPTHQPKSNQPTGQPANPLDPSQTNSTGTTIYDTTALAITILKYVTAAHDHDTILNPQHNPSTNYSIQHTCKPNRRRCPHAAQHISHTSQHECLKTVSQSPIQRC